MGYDSSAVMVEYAMAAPGSAWQPGAGSLEFRHGTQRDALEEFGAGSFDLILSHGVIMYHSDADAFLEEHLALARKGGMLSLVARNAAALAHRAARETSLQDALRLLDAQRDMGHLGVPTRAHTIQEIAASAEAAGASVHGWAGSGSSPTPPPRSL